MVHQGLSTVLASFALSMLASAQPMAGAKHQARDDLPLSLLPGIFGDILPPAPSNDPAALSAYSASLASKIGWATAAPAPQAKHKARDDVPLDLLPGISGDILPPLPSDPVALSAYSASLASKIGWATAAPQAKHKARDDPAAPAPGNDANDQPGAAVTTAAISGQLAHSDVPADPSALSALSASIGSAIAAANPNPAQATANAEAAVSAMVLEAANLSSAKQLPPGTTSDMAVLAAEEAYIAGASLVMSAMSDLTAVNSQPTPAPNKARAAARKARAVPAKPTARA